MSSRRHYSSAGGLHDTCSPRRCLPQYNGHLGSGDPFQQFGLRVAAISASDLIIRHNLNFITRESCQLGNIQAPDLHHPQHVQSQLVVRLRTITWIPERRESHPRLLTAHIFIPTPQRTPVLRQESWVQILYTEDLINAVSQDLRCFADGILILNGSR